jgi:hypothetical protein
MELAPPVRLLPGLLLAGVTLLAASAGLAHDLELTDTLIVLEADGTFRVEITCDLDALALGVSPTADSAELAQRLRAMEPAELERTVERLRRTFERRVRIRFDGEAAEPEVTFPARAAADQGTATAEGETAKEPTFFGLTARLAGRIPEGARELTFRASRAFPPVHLTIRDRTTGRALHQLLELGEPSPPFPLAGEASDGGSSHPP